MDSDALQLSRFLNDLRQSREFAEFILQRKWRDKSPKSRLVHLAFNTSLIVSYCRPFTIHINATGQSIPLKYSPLPIGDLLQLTRAFDLTYKLHLTRPADV
jgi:hypothetical protein